MRDKQGGKKERIKELEEVAERGINGELRN